MSTDYETDGILRMAKELFEARASVARLTERCDAYREALERVDILAGARILCDPNRYAVLNDIRGTVAAALASPAQEQKDKTT